MALSLDDKERYARDGYLLLRGAIDVRYLHNLEQKVLTLLAEWTGRRFVTVCSVEFSAFLQANRELERRLYNEIRKFDWLIEFSLSQNIVGPVADLIGGPVGLMKKIPFRIDLPNVTRELAVWHQDYRYVKGNTDIVTAWIPLQNTAYVQGCLMVMPGTHRLGPIDHDGHVLGKRDFPSGIFEREVRYVEMKYGDLLLFHSLLLHSSGINLSDQARLSLQSRFTRIGAETDLDMGGIVMAREEITV